MACKVFAWLVRIEMTKIGRYCIDCDSVIESKG